MRWGEEHEVAQTDIVRKRLRSETVEAVRGFPTVPGRSEVTMRYGGLGLLLCFFGIHHLDDDTICSQPKCTSRTEYHCLRCGRLCAVLRSVWEDGAPDDDEDGGEGDGSPLDPADTAKVA